MYRCGCQAMKELFFAHWLVFSVNFFMFVAEKLIDLI